MNSTREQFAQSYFNTALRRKLPDSQRNRNRLREILAHRCEGKLLEIGCGTGEFLGLAAQFFDVEALDISEYAIACARQNFPGRVRRADIETEPLASARYEVVAAFNVLEHLAHPADIVGKIRGSLVEGGILAGSVPNLCGLVGGVATLLANAVDRTHISTYSTDHWRRLFEHVGFSRIHLFGEVTFGANHSMHLKGSWWKHAAFNTMFVCKK